MNLWVVRRRRKRSLAKRKKKRIPVGKRKKKVDIDYSNSPLFFFLNTKYRAITELNSIPNDNPGTSTSVVVVVVVSVVMISVVVLVVVVVVPHGITPVYWIVVVFGELSSDPAVPSIEYGVDPV